MALTIDDDRMTSDLSTHTARLAPGQTNKWEVSWLPGRHLGRNSAITAMILADVISDRDMTPREHDWIFIEGWSTELGLTAPEAIAQVTGSPDRRTPGMADPEAAG